MTSREESPDWLRAFQPPSASVTLSSDSEPLQDSNPSQEDKVDQQEPFLNELSQISEEEKGLVTVKNGTESPIEKISQAKSPKKRKEVKAITPYKRRKTDNKNKEEDRGANKVATQVTSKKPTDSHDRPPLLELSSDSESLADNDSKKEGDNCDGESSKFKPSNIQGRVRDEDEILSLSGRKSPSRKVSEDETPNRRLKGSTPTNEEKTIDTTLEEKKLADSTSGKGNEGDAEVEEEASVKHIEPRVSSSSLPLVLPEKVNRSKVLVECEGDSIDLSGDVGAVGRVVISDTPSGSHEMYLDLKGTIYKTSIIPSRTFCVVEAIMNDFVQLKPQSNVYEAETMVEGTLDGFSFDSEDELEKLPKGNSREADKDEGNGEENTGKTNGKAAKKSGAGRRKGKNAGEKPQSQKKVRKKTQVSRKAKNKK